MADVKNLAEELVNLTVKEVNELAEILKEEYGIEPAAAAVPKPAEPAASEPAAAAVPKPATHMPAPTEPEPTKPAEPSQPSASQPRQRPREQPAASKPDDLNDDARLPLRC